MFPSQRPRRLRSDAALSDLVSETRLSPRDFVLPLFVDETVGESLSIASLPGVARHSPKAAVAEAVEAERLGLRGVLLFGVPAAKDALGSGAWSPCGGVQETARRLRDETGVVVITDVCLCEYTDHGHCGVVEGGVVANDATLPLLARAAVSQAEAGAHVVAPSAMMDGQVATIRAALDEAGYTDVAILSYAAKYASALYGPFRDAVRSAPAFGDRRSHQMNPANVREAVREVSLDQAEGADMVMVKPAGPFLDVVRAVRESTLLPVAAYQVSGEYAMLKAAAERGWIDHDRAFLESLLGIRRAGADIVVTYFAKDAARLLAG